MESRLKVDQTCAGDRLDRYLAQQMEGLTRSAAARLLEEGRVTLAGIPLEKNYRLRGGEELWVELPEPAPSQALPQDIPLDVVYEDADIIVVDKPVGMVVHPAPGHSDGTLVNALLHHCAGSLSGVGGELRPGIVHRIDRDTSGLIVAAKNDAAHLALAAQLQDHSMRRTYEAVVVGNLREDSGTVDAPIGRSEKDRKKMAVTEKNSRSAITHWQVLRRYGAYTYIRCQLETGRTHQIRVHMAYIGHPLYGDTVYGAKKPAADMTGQCLHAVALDLRHPRTGIQLHFTSPLPGQFQALLDRLEHQATT